MSPQHCSLAYADVEAETELFHSPFNQHVPTLKLMERSKTDITTMDDIVEFSGTITVSF